jgi:hypothetical protein
MKMATRGSWKPGQSGNPRGRPPTEATYSNALREELAKIDPVTGRKNVHVIAEIAVARAKAGEPWAVSHIANRLEGLPTANMTIETRRDSISQYTDAELEELIAKRLLDDAATHEAPETTQ